MPMHSSDQDCALLSHLPTDSAAVDGSAHLLLPRAACIDGRQAQSVVESLRHAGMGHQQTSSRPELGVSSQAADVPGLHTAALLDALPATATSMSLASSRHRGARTPSPASETTQSAGRAP